ncbi:TetR/AcrR family transcriptional regulator [Kitasatospora sp. NPDC089797]|uniref:TetR/AcrR family transcriptional regulator n=1 Tax=Kitasatospora sp. NPDC089797 TaxID=3155298 RepID=UPI003415C66E
MVKQARAWQTRERVLDAAAAEFAAHGFAATKVEAVVARTGMTKGALYAHFGSKHQLAVALVTESSRHWELIREPPDEQPSPSPGSALTELIRRMRGQFESNVRFRAALRLAADCERRPGDSAGLFADIRQEMVTGIRKAQAELEVTPVHSPESLAYLVLAVLYGSSYLPAGDADRGGAGEPDEAWRAIHTVLHPA